MTDGIYECHGNELYEINPSIRRPNLGLINMFSLGAIEVIQNLHTVTY